MFVIIAIAIAIGVLTTVVIPAFAQVFDSVKMDLPLPTIIILAVSGFATKWWLQILMAIGLGIVAFRYWSNTERGRYLWDRTKLQFPKVGNILLRATIARFVRAFGVALQSGVPITQALAGVAATTGNTYITEKFCRCKVVLSVAIPFYAQRHPHKFLHRSYCRWWLSVKKPDNSMR